jgi:serine protease Do
MFGSMPAGALFGAALLALYSCGAPPVPAPSAQRTTTAPALAPAAAQDAASPGSVPAGAQWVAESKPELRVLTVVIRAVPPPVLVARYERLAQRFRRLEPLFKMAAAGGFGSGFVMVPRRPGDESPRVLLVSNRHVVGLASEVSVTLQGESASRAARVLYVDDVYDLAVLAFESEEGLPLRTGFAFATEPARDQDAVVASGYPGVGDRPSYQVTRGFVSNERFKLDDDADETYVQHTAPIDPGSSGGPLTTPGGELLGVNTLKIRGRENVGLAVPAPVVARALERLVRPAPAPGDAAQAACDALLGQLARGARGVPAVERSLGAALVAELGVPSLAALPPAKEEWIARFVDDPTSVLLHAVALRLAKGVGDGACQRVPSDTKTASFEATLAGGERLLTFAPEQGRWKLVKADLGTLTGPSFLDGAQRPPPKKWKPSLR